MTKKRKPSARALARELEIAQGNLKALAEVNHLQEKQRAHDADMAVVRKFIDAVGAAGVPHNSMVTGGYVDHAGVARHFGTTMGDLEKLAAILRRNLPL